MSVWMCRAHATCDDCEVEYGSNNAMGLMAKHCKKTGHTGQVSMVYGIDYSKDSKEEEKDELE